MMTHLKNIAAAAIIACMVACGGSDTPKSVAENFLKAMNKMDYETAKKYGSADTGKLLDMMSGFAKMMPDSAKKEKSFEIKDEKIEGDKAIVTYTESGEEGEQTLNLLKVDGKWKVAMSKDSMNGEGDGSMDSGATSTDTNSTMNGGEPVPPDSSAR
jgi:hypothetical protein